MGNFVNRANFRLPVFGGFTRFGGLESPKDTKLACCPDVRWLVSMLVSTLVSLLVCGDDIF